jgi:hypothetical protein
MRGRNVQPRTRRSVDPRACFTRSSRRSWHAPRAHCRVKGSGAIGIELAAPDRRTHRMTYRDQTYPDQMIRRWSPLRAGVALVAAYALALQALFASLGAGAALVHQQAATIAGVICSGSGIASLPAPGAPMEHDSTDCCILCGTPAPALVDHVSALTLAIEGLSSRSAAPLGVDHHATMAWLSGGARAPPAA